MSSGALRVAVVGATGLVGSEIVSLLAERRFPVGELLLFASERSRGEMVEFAGETIEVRAVVRPMPDVDVAFLCAAAEVDADLGTEMAAAGALVIDLAPGPGPFALGAADVRDLGSSEGRLARLPDPLARMIAVPLITLRSLAAPRRVLATLFVSASTFGRSAVDRLAEETTALLNLQSPADRPGPEVAFRCVPCEADAGGIAARVEEQLGTLLGEPVPRAVSVARVPAFHGQAAAVSVELAEPVAVDAARRALREAPSLLVAEPAAPAASTLDAVGADGILITGLRCAPHDPRWLHFWALGDSVRQGAALAAVALAEGVLLRH